jgi:hypothetical protein
MERCTHQFPPHGHADTRCILPAGHKGHHKCSGKRPSSQWVQYRRSIPHREQGLAEERAWITRQPPTSYRSASKL